MCGIVGISWTDTTLIKKMMKQIQHRGPDQNGTYSDENVTLGHQRLSIIDLSPRGKQPMSTPDEKYWIIFNGEIYNHKEIKKKLAKHKFNSTTDTEVIVHAYQEWGPKCVQMLNGDFAFCIYDVEKKELFLARDRVGIKPLYYYFDGQQILFASEYKAIIEHNFPRKINKLALSKYLTFRYNYGRETLIEGINRVLPGETITFNIKTKKITLNKYWQIQFDKQFDYSENRHVQRVTELLKDSVQLRLMSDVPLGVYLSGGIDSASIVALMHEGAADINTFSIGFGDPTDETTYARMISEQFNTNHHEFTIGPDIAKTLPKVIWHCDEPLADPALLPVYYLSQQTKKHATVILTGDGGDEIFGGYEQNKFMKLAQIPYSLRKISAPALKYIPVHILNKLFPYAKQLGKEGIIRATNFLTKKKPEEQYLEIVSLFNEQEKSKIMQGLPEILPEIRTYFETKKPILHKVMHFEFETQLPENMLHKGDRMTMAFGIEGRVPYLDHRLAEYSQTIPPSLKLKGLTEKYILRKAMQEKLPKQIAYRKKQRFYVPIDKWLKHDLQPLMDTHLTNQQLNATGINPAEIKRIREKYDHSPLFYARQLWTILTLQIWADEFINQ